MIAAMGFGFAITGTVCENPKQPLSVFVTVTKYDPLVETLIACDVAPVGVHS